jgi:hypothetical protein
MLDLLCSDPSFAEIVCRVGLPPQISVWEGCGSATAGERRTWPEESASCNVLPMHPFGTTLGALDLASAIAPNRSKNHSLAILASR